MLWALICLALHINIAYFKPTKNTDIENQEYDSRMGIITLGDLSRPENYIIYHGRLPHDDYEDDYENDIETPIIIQDDNNDKTSEDDIKQVIIKEERPNEKQRQYNVLKTLRNFVYPIDVNFQNLNKDLVEKKKTKLNAGRVSPQLSTYTLKKYDKNVQDSRRRIDISDIDGVRGLGLIDTEGVERHKREDSIQSETNKTNEVTNIRNLREKLLEHLLDYIKDIVKENGTNKDETIALDGRLQNYYDSDDYIIEDEKTIKNNDNLQEEHLKTRNKGAMDQIISDIRNESNTIEVKSQLHDNNSNISGIKGCILNKEENLQNNETHKDDKDIVTEFIVKNNIIDVREATTNVLKTKDVQKGNKTEYVYEEKDDSQTNARNKTMTDDIHEKDENKSETAAAQNVTVFNIEGKSNIKINITKHINENDTPLHVEVIFNKK